MACLKKLALLALCLLPLLAGCGGQMAGGEEEGDLLTKAWRAYTLGDFDIALSLFSEAAEDPEATRDERFSALLGRAGIHHLNPDPDLPAARRAYEELAGLGGPRAECASLLGLAGVDAADGKDEEAIQKLEQLRRQHPDRLEADEATIQIAQILFEAEEDDDEPSGFAMPSPSRVRRGMRLLEERLQQHPENLLAGPMHLMLGARYVDKGNFEAGVNHLQGALRSGISAARTRADIQWQIARIAEKELKDYALAEKYYERFTTEAKRHVLYYRATLSLERVRAKLRQSKTESPS